MTGAGNEDGTRAGALPDDRGIPALGAMAADGIGPVLARAGVPGGVERVRLLKHQPGRCTFDVTCGGTRMAVKAYSPARAAVLDLCERLEREGLATGRPPTIPPIVACSRSLGLLAMRWLDGASGRALIEAGQPARAGELGAAWLRVESRLSAQVGRRYGAEAALQDVARWARKIGRVDRELGADAVAVLDGLRAAAPPNSREGVCHGDFSPEHVLDLGDGPGVIDLDGLCRGALELDAARFLAALDWFAGERPDRRDRLSAAAAALRAGVDDLVDERALAWYHAVVHVRLAKKLCREIPRHARWRARATSLLAGANGAIEELSSVA